MLSTLSRMISANIFKIIRRFYDQHTFSPSLFSYCLGMFEVICACVPFSLRNIVLLVYSLYSTEVY